jgi:hypothetical protein
MCTVVTWDPRKIGSRSLHRGSLDGIQRSLDVQVPSVIKCNLKYNPCTSSCVIPDANVNATQIVVFLYSLGNNSKEKIVPVWYRVFLEYFFILD